jgi:aspartate-semialdehyde dehydrogenase
MPSDRDGRRIVIAGASSLLGAELKSLLEESRFAAVDFRLIDEELAVGTLTEAGGEAAIIQPVEEGSFNKAQFVFFTGSADFTRTNVEAARQAGATVIDLSGALAGETGTTTWFPALDAPQGEDLARSAGSYAILSAASAAIAGLSLALASVGARRLTAVCFQPVSEAGRAGVEELETQTSQLLSFQSVGKPVFDTQVAFTLLDRFGPDSPHRLGAARGRIRQEVAACLADGKAPMPAIQVLHAPVFYGTTFAACAELEPNMKMDTLRDAATRAGFAFLADGDGPSNVSAAGESIIQLALPEADNSQPGVWWFWGAADNIRLPAANAVRLADKLA